ncbi:LPS-assembly protein LptD [Kordiimonas marina]|uniref:LPS-assembly protein LptD n=1 Tax=Kordiimonas marina TaxID=2872312 RepID=UPI001FF2AA24|nr:LPS assembly protein LptD [Kordiimonas marina]
MPRNFTADRLSIALAALCFTTALTAPCLAVHADDSATHAAPESEDQIELTADQLSYDAQTGDIVARGRVQLVRDGYVLKAGEVRYNQKTGHAEASGAVELTAPGGERILSPHVTLDDKLTKAFVEDIRLVMQDGAQARAKSGKRDGDRITLDHAVYSPCKVCDEKGYKEPLWQLKAVRVVHDRKKHRLYYKDASLEILGIPILWTPYFSHPDPTVKKASGFLPLELQTSKDLGFVVGLPYYQLFNDSQDMTITPILTTKEGPVLATEYRQNLGFGQFMADGSITSTNTNGTRGHFRSSGVFNHSKRWRSTYQVAWASDDTYLRRYGFSTADTLMSQYKLEGFYGASYISARTMAFQGLRLEDVAGKTAYALPLIDAEYVAPFKPLGGTFRATGNLLALHRSSGLDTQRISVSADWQRRWITPKGFVLDVDGLIRTDAYHYSDLSAPDDPAFLGSYTTATDTNTSSDVRTLSRLTGTLSWPLVKLMQGGSQTIEPILEMTVSPARANAAIPVVEDSRAFELTALNLFSSERAAGYDLWEDGSRLTYGLRWRYDGSDLHARVMVGQSWRISGSNVILAQGTGLEGTMSDFVGQTEISYKDWLDIDHRYRLDDKTMAFRRNEVNLRIGSKGRHFSVGYFKLDRSLNFINREDREEIRGNALFTIDNSWQLYGGLTQRLKGAVINGVSEGAGSVDYNFGVTYINECIELGIRYKRSFTKDRDIVPGTSLLFTVKLKNLG